MNWLSRTSGIELRYVTRTLVRAPVFSLTAILSVGLSLGTSVAAFEVLRTAVLRNAPWPEPSQLFLLGRGSQGVAATQTNWNIPRIEEIRKLSSAFASGTGVFTEASMFVESADSGASVRIPAELVGDTYFPALNVSPVRGRPIGAAPGGGEAHSVAVVSSRFARRHFHGVESVVGVSLKANGVPFTVIGVMPEDFHGVSGAADVWLPLADGPRLFAEGNALGQLDWRYSAFLRLRGSATVLQRKRITDDLAQAMSLAALGTPTRRELRLVRADELLVEPGLRSVFSIVLGTALCLLLLVCTNLASLFAARAAEREMFTAIRVALGANRLQIFRLIALECGIIAVAGGLLGVAVAHPAARALWRFRPTVAGDSIDVLAGSVVTLNGGVVAFSVIATAVAFTAMALLPALRLRIALDASPNVVGQPVLSSLGRGSSLGRLRQSAAATQIALAFALGINTIALGIALRRAIASNYGYSHGEVVTARFDLPKALYDSSRSSLIVQRVLTGLRALPGVTGVAVDNAIPLGGSDPGSAGTVDLSLPTGEGGRGTPIRIHSVNPEFFSVIGATLTAGTSLPGIGASEPLPMVINRAAATRYWPGRSSIGQPIESVLLSGARSRWMRGRVVGVVNDIQYDRPGRSIDPAVFFDVTVSAPREVSLFVKSNARSRPLIGEVRRAIRAIDPNVVLYDAKTLDDRLLDATSATRFSVWIVAAYAAVALAVAVMGVYAILMSGVTRRSKEFAIRMALGAQSRLIWRSAVHEGAIVVVAGIALGCGAALFSTRLVGSQLFGVGRVSASWYAGAAMVFLVAGVAASVVPAIRAISVDPIRALRGD